MAVHGAIVVAVGSSFPEISSVVISTVIHVECLASAVRSRYVAQDGNLTLVFHAADYEELRSVVAELRAQRRPVLHHQRPRPRYRVRARDDVRPGRHRRSNILTPTLVAVPLMAYVSTAPALSSTSLSTSQTVPNSVGPAVENAGRGLVIITVGVEAMISVTPHSVLFDTPTFHWKPTSSLPTVNVASSAFAMRQSTTASRA